MQARVFKWDLLYYRQLTDWRDRKTSGIFYGVCSNGAAGSRMEALFHLDPFLELLPRKRVQHILFGGPAFGGRRDAIF